MRVVAVLAAFALLLTPAAYCATGTATVNLTVGAESTITITTGTTTLTTAGSNFSNYTGTTNFTYQIRTTQTGGTGNVQLEVTTDFSPAGGPSIATPPTAGDALSYTCTGSGSSAPTPCTGSQTASTTASTPVLNFAADAHSTMAGDAGSVNWTLTNDPKYKTGTYSAIVTFTISAT